MRLTTFAHPLQSICNQRLRTELLIKIIAADLQIQMKTCVYNTPLNRINFLDEFFQVILPIHKHLLCIGRKSNPKKIK